MENLQLEDEGNDKVEDVENLESLPADIVETGTADTNPECPGEVTEEEDEDTRTPQEKMDSLLEAAFFQSLRTTASAKKAELPMLSSNFYRLHMVPCSHQPLDVKKSSHKKLSKLLAHMERHGVITLKELTKGVESIVAVDYEHEWVTSHRLTKQPPE